MPFQVTVVTPEEELVDARADSVVLRSSDGDLTVLDGHTPVVTDVVPGEMRIDGAEGGPVRLAVHGGFLQVETGPDPAGGRSTRVTVLAGTAERAGDIDVPRATKARDAAAARVEELNAGRSGDDPVGAELAGAEDALRRAEVRLEVAQGG